MQRVSLPFALATVCRAWRSLTLARSIIWTYISCDLTGPLNESKFERIQLLLDRSGTSGIHIALVWDDDLREDDNRVLRLFWTLRGHVSRFERVQVHLPFGMINRECLDLFKLPTPSLTHVHLIADPNFDALEREYFPDAPKLTVLSIGVKHMMCASAHDQWPNIREVAFYDECTLAQWTRFTSICSTRITSLTFGMSRVDFPADWHTFTPVVPLPKLVTLTVLSMLPTNRILFSAPDLRHLIMYQSAWSTELELFLLESGNRVTTLTLSTGTIEEGESDAYQVPPLDLIRALPNITRLEITSLWGWYTLSDAFFNALAGLPVA